MLNVVHRESSLVNRSTVYGVTLSVLRLSSVLAMQLSV